MSRLTFSEADQQALHKERFEHPHPRVQQRMEVLWLISQGLVYPEAARLAGVSEATVDRYVACYADHSSREGQGDQLRQDVACSELPPVAFEQRLGNGVVWLRRIVDAKKTRRVQEHHEPRPGDGGGGLS